MVNGGLGPFVSIDMDGREPDFCCCLHERELCADSELCKVWPVSRQRTFVLIAANDGSETVVTVPSLKLFAVAALHYLQRCGPAKLPLVQIAAFLSPVASVSGKAPLGCILSLLSPEMG